MRLEFAYPQAILPWLYLAAGVIALISWGCGLSVIGGIVYFVFF